MRDCIDPWMDHVSARESSGTARVYRSHLLAFFAWLGEQPLSACVIEDYITHCVKQDYAKVTINGKISAIKSFCRWYCPRRKTEDPSTGIMPFKRADVKPRHRRFLTEVEYRKVLTICEDGIELDTIEFLANTGLRRAEYLAFDPKHILPGGTHFVVVGKGKKERRVPVNAKVKDVVKRSRHEDGTLRCVTYWKHATRLWEHCQSLGRRAGIPAFGPHALRHYFATSLIRKGIPLKVVSQILGHSSVLLTESTYCHLIPEDTTGVTEILCS